MHKHSNCIWWCIEIDEELWADVKGYEGLYQVSNLGNVRRLGTTKIETTDAGEVVGVWRSDSYILKQTRHTYGYMVCGLTKSNTTTSFRVHRLVADAFLPHDSVPMEVHHIDRNSLNNSVDNLEWMTGVEHVAHHRTKSRRTYLD